MRAFAFAAGELIAERDALSWVGVESKSVRVVPNPFLMKLLFALLLFTMSSAVFAQTPPPGAIEPGVPLELAKWRASHYSDVRYKLNLTLEKMSPVLKGTMEIRVRVSGGDAEKGSGGEKPGTQAPSPASPQRGEIPPIILDWRKIKGHEKDSTISNISVNGVDIPIDYPALTRSWRRPDEPSDPTEGSNIHGYVVNEHLIFYRNVRLGENVIKLDFTSPILTSGSAITRYVDKEDGAEYIYSLFVPSDASTAFPVFDQPDLKAKFELAVNAPTGWSLVGNGRKSSVEHRVGFSASEEYRMIHTFGETLPISTYVFAFAAGPFETFSDRTEREVIDELSRAKGLKAILERQYENPTELDITDAEIRKRIQTVFVRKSQAAKFKPHAAEVFRLNTEAVKYFEQYFDYKFPFPKYDLVLIPEFPFGGMEHAGATFLREASIIFPQEPTKNDLVSRATLIFHETAHQWFGDTVTMRWFDDLWLKEGFATFTAYKALEKIMPEMNSWKVFYERIKQGAYQTDSTRGTTAIYQPIANLSAAKSAYGNIVYNKAPAFLRQAEFYLGEDKFQTAARAFLKKHEFGNAGWEDLVKEFETASGQGLSDWSTRWVLQKGMPIVRVSRGEMGSDFCITQRDSLTLGNSWTLKFNVLDNRGFDDGKFDTHMQLLNPSVPNSRPLTPVEKILSRHATARCVYVSDSPESLLIFPNYGDYGYGIFLLDEKSREYVLKNIQNEKDPFLRTMMWGALWDSVREGELDPRAFVELVVTNLAKARTTVRAISSDNVPELDESTVQLLLSRVSVAMNYYIAAPDIALTNVRASASADLRSRVEDLLIERMRTAPTLGQRITFYRAFLNVAASEKARGVLKSMLVKSEPPPSGGGQKVGIGSTPTSSGTVGTKPGAGATNWPPANAGGSDLPLKSKDQFDIITRLLILNDPDAPKLLADLEKTETSDDAKRYAYAARAGIQTAENKAKYWNDFVNNKDISESWIEAAFGPWNSIRHSDLTLPYLERALKELPNHKRNRKIFFVNGWLGAFIGGQRSAEALAIVNKFLADNPGLDNDLRLKILENVDVIERAVKIRGKFGK